RAEEEPARRGRPQSPRRALQGRLDQEEARHAPSRGLRPPGTGIATGRFIPTTREKGVLPMKYYPVLAIACVAALAACSIKEERVVQPAPVASTVVATPAPAATVYTAPAPVTTVYTR